MSAPNSKPVHSISVRELVEFVLRQGNLGGKREFVGSDRALAGIRGHQKIQRSRPSGYRCSITAAARAIKPTEVGGGTKCQNHDKTQVNTVLD